MPSSRVPSSFKVTFPGAILPSQPYVTSARLIQAPLSHDVLVLATRNTDGLEPLLNGAPVQMFWQQGANTGSFCGYVHRVDGSFGSNSPASRVLCVGASYPLMQRGARSWVGARASDVVRDVAAQFGFGTDVEEHPLVYPQVLQAGDSYWALLVRLARETGYVFRMEGTTLVFRSRASMVSHFRPIAPAILPQDFTPKVGAFNPEIGVSRADRTVFGIIPETGEVLSETQSLSLLADSTPSPYQEILVDQVVSTAVEASTAAEASQEHNRFTTLATMTCAGTPFLAPERMVHVKAPTASMSGYWTIRKVEHLFDVGSYQCSLELGADGLGQTRDMTGEYVTTPASNPSHVEVNPHRPGALAWPYPDPVLQTTASVVGVPGNPVSDFSWVAPVSEMRR